MGEQCISTIYFSSTRAEHNILKIITNFGCVKGKNWATKVDWEGYSWENHHDFTSLGPLWISAVEHGLFFSVPSAGPGYEITLTAVIQSSSQASILWAVPQSVRNQSLAYIVITVENQTSIVQMLTSYNTSGSFALSGLGWWCRNHITIIRNWYVH